MLGEPCVNPTSPSIHPPLSFHSLRFHQEGWPRSLESVRPLHRIPLEIAHLRFASDFGHLSFSSLRLIIECIRFPVYV